MQVLQLLGIQPDVETTPNNIASKNIEGLGLYEQPEVPLKNIINRFGEENNEGTNFKL